MVRTSSADVKTTLVVTRLQMAEGGDGGCPRTRARDDAATPGGGIATGAAGSRLDRWVDSYAARTRGMTASEIRALFAVASRPEVVSLAGGMPFLSALPLDVVGEALARLVAERGSRGAPVRLRSGRPRPARADHRRDGARRQSTRTPTTSS